MARVLVIGASGILAPLAGALVARGDAVTGVARVGVVAAGAVPVHADARDADALAASLGGARFDAVVAYEPATSAASRELLRGRAPRLVRVRTSAAADPACGDLVVAPDTLLLGWVDEDGIASWHDPAAVSAAALAVLDGGDARVLGAVRPWSRRPGGGA